jgi:predicted nucleic acid-binding protein
MPRVIVNSTPLIILSNINQLNLLKDLYSEIYIPETVFKEVTEKADSACQQIKENTDWIHVCKIKDESQKRMYQAKLHAGEVEVMILAQEKPVSDLVILDDNAAKKTAKFLGLKVTGSLGVILKAKKTGLIKEVAPLMNQLISNGFYITKEIYDLVKSEAGE